MEFYSEIENDVVYIDYKSRFPLFWHYIICPKQVVCLSLRLRTRAGYFGLKRFRILISGNFEVCTSSSYPSCYWLHIWMRFSSKGKHYITIFFANCAYYLLVNRCNRSLRFIDPPTVCQKNKNMCTHASDFAGKAGCG